MRVNFRRFHADKEVVRQSARLDLLLAFRAGTIGLVILSSVLVPSLDVPSTRRALTLTLLFLVAIIPFEMLVRRSGSNVQSGLVGAMHAVDAAYIVLVIGGSGGPASVLAVLAPLHIVAATLLVSYRAGLRLAAVYTGLLVLSDLAMRAGIADVVFPEATASGLESAASAVALLLVAGVTAAFSAVNERELRKQRAELSELVAIVDDLARTDSLTGLANRRELDRVLQLELLRAGRRSEHLSFVLIDLDHFKEVNDTHGHQVGDEVLRHVGQVVRNELRRTDLGARYGGEELVLLLPACGQEEAIEVAERVRTAIQREAPVPFTASAGVATFPLDAQDSTTMLAAADTALYRAKAAGRNRTAVPNPSVRN